MHNLLTDPLIRVRLAGGTSPAMSLPDVYEAMAADRATAFPALRPHQRHAWHAFLAQLGAIALHRAGANAPPRMAADWRIAIRGLTPEFADDEPWRLVVDDPTMPAFLQCPAPNGLGDYRGQVETPDDLDVLVTAKNHDVKRTVALRGSADDWIFALIDLQTMAGFLGAGNYGVARMNGGFSARPCLGLAPADGGPGAHLLHDVRRMLDGRDALLKDYRDYFTSDDGVALVWLEPWNGANSLDLRRLDPHFIEICRRVRLRTKNGTLVARTASSKAPRIAAKAAHGNLGDFWTPVSVTDGKALSLSDVGFRYDRLAKLIFDTKDFRHPPSMQVDGSRAGRWRVVARGVAGGQGKTDGYHERADVAFEPKTAAALFRIDPLRIDPRDALVRIAGEQLEEIKEVTGALRFGVAVAASGGAAPADLTKADRTHANPYARRLDAAADARFFGALEQRFLAANEADAAAGRAGFARDMIAAAEELLSEAIETVPCPSIRRHRARARATSAFRGRLRRHRSVFSNQPEIFDAKETSDDP